MKALEVTNLTYSYQQRVTPTIDHVSFAINEGEYVSIVGPNGSGKSTLARLIMMLLNKSEGDVYLFEEKLSKENVTKLRSRVGIVFQNPDNQFIGATVEDDIAFGLENKNIARKEMRDIIHTYLDKVHMSPFLNKEPSNLSGGQKQRVAIAGVLALNPDILILDEATSMLDPKGKKDINNLIKEIKKSKPNLTIISITHDVEEAYQSDRVIVLAKGKLVKFDTPEKVFTSKEELEKIHLSIPFFMELSNKLNKKVTSIDEAVEGLCQLK